MAMPRDLVLMRHGESEANIVQRLFKADPSASAPEGFADRHDTQMRLTNKGKEQASSTGKWLLSQFPDRFDKYYVSPLARARETAGLLALHGAWQVDDRWRERDYGELSALNHEERRERYPQSTRLKDQHEWYWCPPGGESLATGVRLRFEDILGTLHRQAEDKRVIAVTHGDMIGVARYVLEHMDPDEFVATTSDPSQKINNCQVLHYSRVDPETQELAPQLRWLRSVAPCDSTGDWNSGEWMEIAPRRTWSDRDLLESVEAYPNMLSGE
jgi:broad specificity phosphatase PhoE